MCGSLSIAICEDVPAERELLLSLARDWARGAGARVFLEAFASAEALVFHRAGGKEFDLLLLDIGMRGMSGMELARELRAQGCGAQIVFITGYADCMAEGYDVGALHYLLKPVSREKLFSVLDRARAHLPKPRRAVLLPCGDGVARLFAEEILYAEVFSHSMVFHADGTHFEARMTVAQAQAALGEGFVRCHRSYIVNLCRVRQIRKTDLLLDDGRTVPLARRAWPEVNRAFLTLCREEIHEDP